MLTGTYEKIEEEEEEIYEVVNVHKLKSATPNLRVVNLYGINFVDDTHVEAFSSNCIQASLSPPKLYSPILGSDEEAAHRVETIFLPPLHGLRTVWLS